MIGHITKKVPLSQRNIAQLRWNGFYGKPLFRGSRSKTQTKRRNAQLTDWEKGKVVSFG